jgi:hypothetical protein
MQTQLAEMESQAEKKRNPPKKPNSNGSSRHGSRLNSRGMGGIALGSEALRKAAGVTLARLASPINSVTAAAEPNVEFLQACEFSELNFPFPRPNRRAAMPRLKSA